MLLMFAITTHYFLQRPCQTGNRSANQVVELEVVTEIYK